MKGEETCFPIFGISVFIVGLYLQLLNTEFVFTVWKLLKIHSETIKWLAALHLYYPVINQNICYFSSPITNWPVYYYSESTQ